MRTLKILLPLLISLWGNFAFASVDTYKIDIQGAEQTKPAHVRFVVKQCIEQQIDKKGDVLDIPLLEKCVLNKKLFSEVKITQSGNSITVTVADRWSLIPIPMISSSEGQSTQYGFFLMETNFLGSGKVLVGGWVGSKDTSQTFLMYKDPEILGTKWNFTINYSNADKENFLFDKEEEVDGQKFKEDNQYVEVGYNFTKQFRFGISYTNTSIQYESLGTYEKLDDLNSQYIGASFRWDESDFKFYFQEGLKVEYYIQKQFYRNDDEDFSTVQNLRLNWQRNGFSDMVLQTKLIAGQVDKGDQRDLMAIGDQPGLRGIQSGGAWVKRYCAAAFDYQIPVKTIEEGTWTIAPFIDVGYLDYNSSLVKDTTYTSAGIGTYFFLKKISFPGIGVIYGYNNKFQESFYKVTIGFSM